MDNDLDQTINLIPINNHLKTQYFRFHFALCKWGISFVFDIMLKNTSSVTAS